MNDKTTHNQVTGASETTRFFCTRISSAASAESELCTTRRKEPNMGKRNTNSWEGQRPRCPQPPKSSYLKNSTITSVNFHSSKGPSPEVPLKFLRSKRTKGAQQSILRCAPFCIGLSALLRAVGCCRLRKQLGILDKPDELSPIAFSICAFRCAGTL